MTRCPTCSRPTFCGAAIQRELQQALALGDLRDEDGEPWRQDMEARLRMRSKLGMLILGLIMNRCEDCACASETAQGAGT